MKYDAMKHQGSKGEKHTADEVGEKAGDSGRTVQRYIRLASLIDGLINMVDAGKIGMTVGEKLSYLKNSEQEWVWKASENTGIYPSPMQAGQIKEQSENGSLCQESIYKILVKKEKIGRNITLSANKIRDYFPPAYTREQMEEVIYTLLDEWKKGKEGEEHAETTI